MFIHPPVWRPRDGERVIVNTGGADAPAWIENPRPHDRHLGDVLLCHFDNGSKQWIGRQYVRPVEG
jgi:hypothetical protein